MSPHKLGFLQGLFAAIVLGFVINRLRWLWGEINEMFRPQRVSQATRQTPWQVVRWGLFLIICVLVLLVAPACVLEPARCTNVGALLMVLFGEVAGFVVVVVQTLLQIIGWLWGVVRDFLS